MCKDLPAAGNALCSARLRRGRDVRPHRAHLRSPESPACRWDGIIRGVAGRRDCSTTRTGLRVADLATGTGDLLIAMLRRRPEHRESDGPRYLRANAGPLPREASQDRAWRSRRTPERRCLGDAVSRRYVRCRDHGVRHSQHPRRGSDPERNPSHPASPGALALILEFSLPENRIIRWCHLKYLRLAVPFIGAVVSGDRRAYRYLNESIESFCRTQDLSAA